MAATVNVTVNVNGLGTAHVYYGSGTAQYVNYAEVHFTPNTGVSIDSTYHYEYTVTYTPEMERDPDTYSGDGSYNGFTPMVSDDCPLKINCAAGSASYFATITWRITITGSPSVIPHSVDPSGSGRFDYFFRRWRGSDRTDSDFYWKVSPVLQDYEFRYIRFFRADGTYYEDSWYAKGSRRNDGYVSCTAYFWIPTATVTLDPNGGVVNPTSIQARENKPYGYLQSLPTPTRQGYRFLGWYTSLSSRGRLVTDETINTSRYDHTLYAKWEVVPIPFTIRARTTKGRNLKVDGTEAEYYCSGYSGTPDKSDAFVHRFTTDVERQVYVNFYGWWGKVNGYQLDHILVNGNRVDDCYWGWDYITAETSFVGVYKPKHEFTYLPMYLPANGMLLRGVRQVRVIRDGDES